TAAALLAWGAAVEGRLSLATRDAQRLGHEGDPVAVALLERFGQQLIDPARPAPQTAGDLYALWVGSGLVAEDYPAMLELWGAGPQGPLLAELQLAQLDLSPGLLATLARSAAAGGGGGDPCIERLEANPGGHYLLVAPLRDGTVLTVGVGSRTRLLPLTRCAGSWSLGSTSRCSAACGCSAWWSRMVGARACRDSSRRCARVIARSSRRSWSRFSFCRCCCSPRGVSRG